MQWEMKCSEIMARVCPWVPAPSNAQSRALLVSLLGGEKEQQSAASASKEGPYVLHHHSAPASHWCCLQAECCLPWSKGRDE